MHELNTLFATYGEEHPDTQTGENWHIFAVAQFPRAVEDGPCDPIMTVYNSDDGQARHWRPKNPSGRRDGLVILLGSETGAWVQVEISQHKGSMYQEAQPAEFSIRPFTPGRGAK